MRCVTFHMMDLTLEVSERLHSPLVGWPTRGGFTHDRVNMGCGGRARKTMDVNEVPFVDSCVRIFRGCTFDVQASANFFPWGTRFANSSGFRKDDV